MAPIRSESRSRQSSRVHEGREPPDARSVPRCAAPLLRGALEALGVVASVVLFGLGWAALAERAARGPDAYPSAMEHGAPTRQVWLVDGFNALHAVVLGGRDRSEWWTEPRRVELIERLTRSAPPDAEVWVVFDAQTPREPSDLGGTDPRVRQVFAPSADEWLVRRLGDESDPSRVAVVTADRRLAARARRRGARVVTPAEFFSPQRS